MCDVIQSDGAPKNRRKVNWMDDIQPMAWHFHYFNERIIQLSWEN